MREDHNKILISMGYRKNGNIYAKPVGYSSYVFNPDRLEIALLYYDYTHHNITIWSNATFNATQEDNLLSFLKSFENRTSRTFNTFSGNFEFINLNEYIDI